MRSGLNGKPIVIPDPPAHLSERSQALWRAIVPRRAKSPERIALVQVALEALDRADQAAAAVTAQGLTTTTKRTGMTHLNPIAKLELESRRQFATIWHNLGLNWSDVDSRQSVEEFLGG